MWRDWKICLHNFSKHLGLYSVKEKEGAVILVRGRDGSMDEAYSTACILLRHMNCRTIHELVCSHHTNEIPAADDINAISGTESIVRFFAH